MAWRDARHNFSRLSLFVASLVAGIAAVVSLDSLNNTIQTDIDQNARELLGADLVVQSNNKFEDEVVSAFDSTRMEQSAEADMASMCCFFIIISRGLFGWWLLMVLSLFTEKLKHSRKMLMIG